MDSPSDISARIEDARKRAGLSQTELGHAIGLTGPNVKRTIHNYEHGRVPWKKLDAIAEALGVTRVYLEFGEDRQAELDERVQMLEAVLEQIRPGWRELLRPPPGLERLGEDDPHSSADPDEPKTDQEDPPPPAR